MENNSLIRIYFNCILFNYNNNELVLCEHVLVLVLYVYQIRINPYPVVFVFVIRSNQTSNLIRINGSFWITYPCYTNPNPDSCGIHIHLIDLIIIKFVFLMPDFDSALFDSTFAIRIYRPNLNEKDWIGKCGLDKQVSRTT